GGEGTYFFSGFFFAGSFASFSGTVISLSPRWTSSFTSVSGAAPASTWLSVTMSGTGIPSTYTIRSSGLSLAFSAGDPAITSSTYGGVRSTTLGTSTIPV